MKLKGNIKRVEVFYDGRCGMCCTFHEWISRQERANAIDFIPYQSLEAEKRFPGISALDPAREMVVRTDEGGIYRAAEAWVWCLWSCAKYRDLAEKLAKPKRLKCTQKVCHLLAANRITLSKLFFRRKNKEVMRDLHQMPAMKCEDNYCQREGGAR